MRCYTRLQIGYELSVSQCPQCHALVAPGANFCGNCRFDLRFIPTAAAAPGVGPAMTAAPTPPGLGSTRRRHVQPPELRPSDGGYLGVPDATRLESTRSSTATGRPQRFLGVGHWLFDAVLKQPRSVLCSIGFIWLFNIPLAVLFGFFGLIGGGIVGAFGGGSSLLSFIPGVSSYVDLFSSELGGFIGAILGALLGGLVGVITGLILPLTLASGGDPIDLLVFLVGQFLIAVVVGIIYTTFEVAFEGRRMQLAGARKPSRRERELILPILESCAASLAMVGRPRLLMDDSLAANASAGTSHIVINAGILEDFQYRAEPIAGVITHELVHWYAGDSLGAIFIKGVSLPLYLAFSLFDRIGRAFKSGFVTALVWIITFPIQVSVRYLLIPMLTHDSRKAEYFADQGALHAGHVVGIRELLEHLRHSIDGSRNGWDNAICASHPPNELRLDRLEIDGQQYPFTRVHTASSSVRGSGDQLEKDDE
jgi:Zn-dependent protease with chaperone function